MHSPGMQAYLIMMATRILQRHELLKETGSMFLHCVPTANAYLRMLMNCVFGNKNFRNEIVWSYKRWSTKMIRAFPRLHDTILFYAKSKGLHKFNADAVRVTFSKPLVKHGKTWKSDDEATLKERTAKGKIVEDWRADIPPLNSKARERTGNPFKEEGHVLQSSFDMRV